MACHKSRYDIYVVTANANMKYIQMTESKNIPKYQNAEIERPKSKAETRNKISTPNEYCITYIYTRQRCTGYICSVRFTEPYPRVTNGGLSDVEDQDDEIYKSVDEYDSNKSVF